MTWLRIVCVLLTLALASASTAAKVCLGDATHEFVYQFGKLKVPKKANVATPVVGLAFSATSVNAMPLSGTLIRDGSTGKLFLGLTRFIQECLLNATLDDALNGTVSYDCDLDGASDGSFELNAVSCPG